uniref:Uncharacterized protein n=1 Tax=Candidatus Methanogaster sp. ANME-2c ERB4 TaxID=2759911 RepID=A0A7G9YBA2_9EURY|nr:hypothetical protein GHMBFEBI_00020 [Methanosarcinales archaeon ANME-2c ERB4]
MRVMVSTKIALFLKHFAQKHKGTAMEDPTQITAKRSTFLSTLQTSLKLRSVFFTFFRLDFSFMVVGFAMI